MKKAMIASAAIALSVVLGAGTAGAAAKTHTVKDNDTFWTLSKQYNLPLKTIMDANKSFDALNLQPGMKLSIPDQSEPSKPKESNSMAAAGQSSEGLVQGPGGYDYVYTKQLFVQATAYTASASENGGWGGVDYFGNKLKVGTIAVDPKMIPLGTKLYITGYDYNGLPQNGIIATATDMGGSIKGNRIDIFVPGTTQQAYKFGIQNVKAYILK
ncbi:3D domain-containing protein [Paenibacillus sp. GCM10027627]|uniref:3D domain-containing protein n=1 Tax=unclassified Paenibacillus TaxID=185978 RepID=UPI00362AD612